jgi:hypothetical protein
MGNGNLDSSEEISVFAPKIDRKVFALMFVFTCYSGQIHQVGDIIIIMMMMMIIIIIIINNNIILSSSSSSSSSGSRRTRLRSTARCSPLCSSSPATPARSTRWVVSSSIPSSSSSSSSSSSISDDRLPRQLYEAGLRVSNVTKNLGVTTRIRVMSMEITRAELEGCRGATCIIMARMVRNKTKDGEALCIHIGQRFLVSLIKEYELRGMPGRHLHHGSDGRE